MTGTGSAHGSESESVQDASFETVRAAAILLSTDFTFAYSSQYAHAWDLICAYLHANESALRFFGLKNISLCARSIGRTLLHIEQKQRIVSKLIEIVTGDESWNNRCLAAQLLGEFVEAMCEEGFPAKIRTRAFEAVIGEIARTFPTELGDALNQDPTLLDSSHYVAPQVFRRRISLVHASALFLRAPEAQTSSYMGYIDRLLLTLLRKKAHPYMQATAIHAIHTHLPVTNRSRLRVEKIFREPIAALSAELLPPPEIIASSTNLSTSATEVRRPSLLHGAVPATSSNISMHTIVKREIMQFWAVWYPRPNDKELQSIGTSTSQTPKLTGYAMRRWNLLSLQNYQRDQVKAFAGLAKASKRVDMEQQMPEEPYDEVSRAFALLSDKMFERPSIPAAGRKEASATSQDPSQSPPPHTPTLTTIHDAPTADPDASTLTLNMTPPILLFNRYPFQKDIFLQNKSVTHDVPFRLQVGPSRFFFATPAYGFVPKGESVTVTVYFTPCPQVVRKTPEVLGFLRVRGANGFPYERISLRGYNTPAIKISPVRLDFGICPIGDTRTMVFMVSNLLPVECPIVTLVAPTETSTMFQIYPTQTILAAHEKKSFQLKFVPNIEAEVSDALLVVALGGELTKVLLEAVGGRALHVLDTRLDFGPTDIYYNPVVRKMTLRNRDRKPLPVTCIASTNELSVHYGLPITLEPFEERRISVSFLSGFTGTRQESLVFHAPNSKPVTLEAAAFSGPTLWMPVYERLMFPIASVSQFTSVQFPIVNFADTPTQFTVFTPPLAPFTVELVPVDVANRKGANSLQLESRPYEGPDAVGLSVTVGPRLTVLVKVNFLSVVSGSFKSTLGVQMTKPRKWTVGTLQLNAFAVDEPFLLKEKSLDAVRKFIANPAEEPATGVMPKRGRASTTAVIKSSEVLELDPPIQTIFGAHLSGRFEDICEFVTLSNLGSTVQKYRLALSEHFYTDAPLEGELEGSASVDIPIRINPSFLENGIGPETMHQIILGSITAFEANDKKGGLVSAGLQGILGDLVSLESREGMDTVHYPSLKVMEKLSRRFILRNRAPVDVVWEARLVTVGQQGTGLGADGLPMIVPTTSSSSDWCPFSLSVPRMNLKPFEIYTVDITFQATSSGDYRAKLFMEYTDPISHMVNAEHMRGRAKRSLPPLVFDCSVGVQDLAFMPEFLHHGDVEIGERVSRPLTIINNQQSSTHLVITTPPPFHTSGLTGTMVRRQTKLELPVLFEPTKSGTFSELLVLSFGGLTRPVPVIGTGGRSGIESNLANPVRVTAGPLLAELLAGDEKPVRTTESTIDFGFVEMGRPKEKMFRLTNVGTFDYSVKNITLDDETHVQWKFEEDILLETQISSEFGNAPLDAVEIDWDEVDHKIGEHAGGTGFGRQSVAASSVNAPVRRRRYKSISTSVVGGPSASSKAFPFRLPASQKCIIKLSLAGFDVRQKGERNAVMKVDVERSNGEAEAYVFWIHGNIQPALQLWEKRVDFGVRAVYIRHKTDIKFTNTGTVPLPWTLTQDSIRYHPMEKFDTAPLPEDEKSIPLPMSFFPTSGKLLPGCTQSVAVAFTPSLAQYEVNSYCTLRTGDFAESQIVVHGVGASSRLWIDVDELDFGTLRIGTKKHFRVSLKNRGILPLRYFVECSNTQFSADPEQGMLEGAGSVEITVKFAPKAVGQLTETLRVLPHMQEGYTIEPLLVSLRGMGSYPELVVLTKNVDFGTALFMTRNVQPVKVQNKGAAEAHVIFSCHHPGISLDNDKENEVVVVGPNTIKDINIVYVPQVVETLKAKAFLRSSDSRGDHFVLSLEGSVGVPKLAFNPPDAMQSLDFGVCAVNGVYKKIFTMSNEGNINLPFILNLENKLTIGHDSEGRAALRPVPTKPHIITAEPTSGSLHVGESVEICITFIPDSLAEYECQINLNYEFKSLVAPIKGVGGRAVLKIDSPLSLIDFGLCRIRRTFKKPLTISNAGNLGVDYHLRPEPEDGDWSVYSELGQRLNAPRTSNADSGDAEEEVRPWVKELAAKGFTLMNPDGHCKPYGKTDLFIEFSPLSEAHTEIKFRVYFGDQFEDINVCGRAAFPRLMMYGQSGELLAGSEEMRTLDLGVHPIQSEHVHTLQLKNEGPFGIDYLVQPFSIREFDVQPLRGFIPPGSANPLRVYFRPTSENKFSTTIKVLWEKEPLRLQMLASGGIGKLEVVYADDKDVSMNGLDFGMVPFNSASEKHFFLFNVGMVEISMEAVVDNDEYVMALVGDPIPLEQHKMAGAPKPPPPSKRTIWNWFSNIRSTIAPGVGLEVVARFVARSPMIAAGSIQIRSEGGSYVVPLRGKGGTIQITHRGDLNMGDIATNHVYRRKLTLVNSGSIPASITAEWLVVGHSSETSSSFVQFDENYSVLDPRSGWARQQLCADRNVQTITLTAKNRWQMIAMMIRKAEDLEEENMDANADPLSALWGNTLGKLRTLLKQQAQAPGDALTTADEALSATPGQTSATGSASNLSQKPAGAVGASLGTSVLLNPKKGLPAQYSAFFKRRQMFFHLISSTQLSSQSLPFIKPYLKVDPPISTLPSYGETTLTVEIDLSTEDTFLATLLIKPGVPNASVHEIALTATPKAISVLCDDTRMLDFHRQPLGESETIMRTFTNVGHKDFNFQFLNPNASLRILPARGHIKVGQTITVRFTFEPVDESIQNQDVVFQPDISQPIRLKMHGAGGYTKVSLSRYRRFDFGHCMIGKDTVSFLPIVNEGNAMLHLTRFELHETDTFFKGEDWPVRRVSLFPNEVFNLPIVFNPHEESPAPGRLVVGTAVDSWEIELVGLGREAVLIVSKIQMEFSECLIGNSYEQKLGLKNVGDVNYPVTFKLDREFPDVEFLPPSVVIHPFNETDIIVAYTPSKETKATINLTVSSPYSSHKIPLVLHAGTAVLEFDNEILDFGMFERTASPCVKLNITNTGTVRTSFSVREMMKPPMFSIGHAKGILYPGRSTAVSITHIKHEVAQFEEQLMIRTDLLDKLYYILVKGQCEEALLRPNEFSLCNMGICPVMETTTKPVSFTNYGKFPLHFTIKSAYPLKVSPTAGKVLGGQSSTFSVAWNPSGGYELRTHIAMVTNIGTFNIAIRGKAAFPELVIKNMYLDFGVCAVGHSYREPFTLTNKGKVPVHFTIAPSREPSYSVGRVFGNLEPKESMDIDAFFKPAGLGKFAHTFMIECKGINYKELAVIGIGGLLKLEYSPSTLEFGRSPCNLRIFQPLLLANKGDVILQISFKIVDANDDCVITLPDPVTLRPSRSTRCFFGVAAMKVGAFTAKVAVCTREKVYSINVTGSGIKIELDPKSKEVLETEKLSILTAPGPLDSELRLGDLDEWIKKFKKRYLLDQLIGESLSVMYTAARGLSCLASTPQVLKRAHAIVVARHVGGPPKQRQIASSAHSPAPTSPTPGTVAEEAGSTVATASPPATDQRPRIQSEGDPLTFIEHPNLGDGDVVPKNAVRIPGPPPAQEEEVAAVQVVTREEENPAQEQSVERTSRPRSADTAGQTGRDANPSSHSPSGDPAMEATPETGGDSPNPEFEAALDLQLQRRMEIVTQIEETWKVRHSVQSHTVGALVDSFIQLKTAEVPLPSILSEDPVIGSVLTYPLVQIHQLDLTDILDAEEPATDIDLGFLLTRPPPFKENKEATPAVVKEDIRTKGKNPWKTWQPLERRMRNAPTVNAFR
ncbi:uncharacterized protein EV422DRAFT_414299 [Fimicolochytrium jonesii]|uniref:uncharacterized protein n=1 Tax=Fimicolochytrium jonesii TaxID=1396493 RepID=UPI0022FDC932|nr:uncharacterized protein EV422DRAFT_414299 [Fimicolochytrium jonesii]KAI8822039.1 hypothetical protein EV422DRAFT_414299 [Fimicolochytrium jonesii]